MLMAERQSQFILMDGFFLISLKPLTNQRLKDLTALRKCLTFPMYLHETKHEPHGLRLLFIFSSAFFPRALK